MRASSHLWTTPPEYWADCWSSACPYAMRTGFKMSEEIENDGADLEQDADALLNAELEKLQAENAALKEQALRYAAEGENIKRRAEREMNDARAFAIQRFANSLLGVADVLARALSAVPADIADP